MDTESKLRNLINRIEIAGIPDTQKEEIYLSIRQALGIAINPVLIRHFSQESIDQFNGNPTPEGYCGMVKHAFHDNNAIEEIDELMGKILDKTEAILKTRKIIN
jgi:hypothetical protein